MFTYTVVFMVFLHLLLKVECFVFELLDKLTHVCMLSGQSQTKQPIIKTYCKVVSTTSLTPGLHPKNQNILYQITLYSPTQLENTLKEW